MKTRCATRMATPPALLLELKVYLRDCSHRRTPRHQKHLQLQHPATDSNVAQIIRESTMSKHQRPRAPIPGQDEQFDAGYSPKADIGPENVPSDIFQPPPEPPPAPPSAEGSSAGPEG